MAIQIQGVLIYPNGEPMKDTLVQITSYSTLEVIKGASTTVETDANGNIDTSLANGIFQLVVKPCKGSAYSTSYVEVTPETPSPISLVRLISEYQPSILPE
ncbi:MAG: hypothetical protein ACRCVV_22015 [Shewanella sp.]